MSNRYEENSIVSEMEKVPVLARNVKYDFSYSPNGDFDRSGLPVVEE